MVLNLLFKFVSESLDAKSIKILQCFLEIEESHSKNSQTNEIKLFMNSKGFIKVSSMFVPTCFIKNIFCNIPKKPKSGLLKHPNSPKKQASQSTIRKIKRERGRLFLYEKLFVHVPEYLDFANNSFNSLMHKEGYLNITFRFYLAIMVYIYI